MTTRTGLLQQALIVLASCVALASACSARALAVMEYCPARAGTFHPVGDRAGEFAFALDAEDPRSVAATVLVQTDSGWFTVQVPQTLLFAHTYDYRSEYIKFKRTEYESAPIYVRFPQAVKIDTDFVSQAQTSGEQALGWDAKGEVKCGPHGGMSLQRNDFPNRAVIPKLTDPRADLDATPPAGTSVLLASIASSPAATTCSDPMTDSTVAKAVMPDYAIPEEGRGRLGMTIIAVAVSAAGTVDDAWTYFPSGSAAFDAAVLAAAKASSYKPGNAFCQADAGVFLFGEAFRPGGYRF